MKKSEKDALQARLQQLMYLSDNKELIELASIVAAILDVSVERPSLGFKGSDED